MLFKAGFVDGSDLLEQHRAVFGKSAVCRAYVDVRRDAAFIALACDSRGNYGGTVGVADVVLDDEHRTDTSLFRADDRA